MDSAKSQRDGHWRIAGGNQQRTGYRPTENLRKDGCDELWRCQIPKANQRMLVADDSYLYHRNNTQPRTVIAIDKSSGTKTWEYTLSSSSYDSGVTTTPLSIGTTIVFREPHSSGGYSLLGLNQSNGVKQWEYTVNTENVENHAGPLVNQATVVYDAGPGGTVTAINIESGETLWSENISTKQWVYKTVIHNEYLYIGYRNNELHCIDCNTGEQAWSAHCSEPIRSLSAHSGIVIAGCGSGHNNHKVIGYDAETGESMWTVSVAGTPSTQMAVDEELVYIGTNAGTTHAIDMHGEEWWTFRSDEMGSSGWISKKLLPGYRTYGVSGPPTVAGDVVLFGSDDGNMYALDAKSGELSWKHHVCICDKPRGGIRCQPVVDDGVIYTVEFASTKNEYKRGYVHALDASKQHSA